MDLAHRIETAMADRLRAQLSADAFRDDYPTYLRDLRSNLIAGVAPQDFQSDLAGGSGNELLPHGSEPPKFCSARSSSALAVNTFGPFRQVPARLTLLGQREFHHAWFERRCPNGLRTRILPHLDFLAETSTSVVGIESKFAEPFGFVKPATFSSQYRRLFYGEGRRPAVAEAPWKAVYDLLLNQPSAYLHLDAAQLVKHYLGLKNTYPTKKRFLLYLYWEPSNAKDFEAFAAHRAEVTDFAERVSGCDTHLVGLPYRTLWTDWERSSPWPGMHAHLARLRARYDVAI